MMTYDFRRLRLHGLIQRIPHTQRYLPTPLGWRTVWFYHHAYDRFCAPDSASWPTLKIPLGDAELSMTSPPDPDLPHKPTPKSKLDSKVRLRRT